MSDLNNLNDFTNGYDQNDNINKKDNFKPIYPVVEEQDIEYTGLMIQITHSPYYASLHNKEDNYHGISCELLSQQIVSTTGSIATDVCERKKAEFLATASSLAYIDGGEQTISRINDLITDDKKKIKQSDLLEKNFLTLFADKDEVFRKTYLQQLKSIYDDVEDKNLTNEVIAVKLAYALKLIARYMSIRNNWDYIETSNFLFDELLKIKKRAKETGRLEIPE